MTAIVRVKRRRDVDPVDAFVVSCKRSKLQGGTGDRSNAESGEVKEYFKFAGTVSENEKTLTKHIRDAIRKEKLEKEYKKHNVDLTSKIRNEQKLVAKSDRYKIISSKRALDLDSLNETEKDSEVTDRNTEKSETRCECKETESGSEVEKVFCLYDVEQESSEKSGSQQITTNFTTSTITCNSVPLVREKVEPPKEVDYVYDLYYTNRQEFDFRMLENILSIEAFNEDYVYDDYRNEFDNEVYDDEDDSNDESNWRNDYPDEDPHIYDPEGEDTLDVQMADLMGARCRLGDDDRYSSEEDDSHFYGETENFGYPTRSYEKYKKYVTEELERGETRDSDDEDEEG